MLGARRNIRGSREIQQVAEMETHLARDRPEPRGIGDGLVDAHDAELASVGAFSVCREMEETSDLEALRFRELPRHEDGSWRALLRAYARDDRDRQHEKDDETGEQRESQCGQRATISL
jgi:hypothetical protein